MTEDLNITLDTGSAAPLYRQIVNRLWLEVVDGTLDPGQRLPTARRLAIDLSVHPDTVARAYKELELLGVVIHRHGEGTFVGLKPTDKQELERRAEFETLCQESVERAKSLGFTLDELIETLGEFRSQERRSESRGRAQCP